MTLSETDLEYVRRIVYDGSSIVIEPTKRYLVDARLGPVAREAGVGTIAELVARLRTTRTEGLHAKVIEAMTTNETSFFRDVHPFEALKKAVLPALIEQRAGARRLDLWCAASSTGQEPYSIAMLLCDAFPALSQGWTVNFIATDLNAEVLERARSGRFSQLEINRGLPAPYMVKFFRREGTDWVLKDEVRGRVTFRQLNLARPWTELPRMDVVFIRNVLIYFDQETKRDILARIRQLLRPDGYLFVGGSESTIHIDTAYTPETHGRSVYFRVRGDGARTD